MLTLVRGDLAVARTTRLTLPVRLRTFFRGSLHQGNRLLDHQRLFRLLRGSLSFLRRDLDSIVQSYRGKLWRNNGSSRMCYELDANHT
jgi:hypothetical protein